MVIKARNFLLYQETIMKDFYTAESEFKVSFSICILIINKTLLHTSIDYFTLWRIMMGT